MNGVDAIVFTAGIGENDDIIRSRIIEHFDFLDTTLDQKATNRDILSSWIRLFLNFLSILCHSRIKIESPG